MRPLRVKIRRPYGANPVRCVRPGCETRLSSGSKKFNGRAGVVQCAKCVRLYGMWSG